VRILLVYTEDTDLQSFKDILEQHADIELVENHDTSSALQMIKDAKVDAVAVGEQLADMSGIEFVEALVKVNPFVNTALSSALPPRDYHEATEGQGVLVQLAVQPGKSDAELFVEKLKKVASLL
jgi:DNA-binding NarL/FixJ family response regulator